MNPMLKKLMDKKGPSKMSDEYVSAKSEMLKNLIGEMNGMAGEGLKKVTVASNSKPGLETGLDKAKEILHGKMTPEGDTGDMKMNPEAEQEEAAAMPKPGEEGLEHEASESPEFEAGEMEGSKESEIGEHSSSEDIDAEISRLQMLKAKKK